MPHSKSTAMLLLGASASVGADAGGTVETAHTARNNRLEELL